MKSGKCLCVLFVLFLSFLIPQICAQSFDLKITTVSPSNLRVPQLTSNKDANYKDMLIFYESIFLIDNAYYRERNVKECIQKILQSGISGCTDRYSHYLTEEETKTRDEEIEGHFFGVGISMGQKTEKGESHMVVMSVVQGSPAYRKGIKNGDFIVAISSDGEKDHLVSTRNLSLYDAVKLIRGEKNTSVLLEIKRGGEFLEFDLVREDIKIEMVFGKLSKPDIGYVKLNGFEGIDLKEDFIDAVGGLKKKGAKALVLDLRNNPGGLLDLAVYISGLFQKERGSAVIVCAKGRNGNVTEYSSGIFSNRGKFGDLKVVVLTNEGSASASEIVAAYLKNYCGAKTVGKKTFGKGLVQLPISLRTGGTLVLTISEYFVGERMIAVNNIGVAPDFEIDDPEKEGEENDLQLKKAIEVAEEFLK